MSCSLTNMKHLPHSIILVWDWKSQICNRCIILCSYLALWTILFCSFLIRALLELFKWVLFCMLVILFRVTHIRLLLFFLQVGILKQIWLLFGAYGADQLCFITSAAPWASECLDWYIKFSSGFRTYLTVYGHCLPKVIAVISSFIVFLLSYLVFFFF